MRGTSRLAAVALMVLLAWSLGSPTGAVATDPTTNPTTDLTPAPTTDPTPVPEITPDELTREERDRLPPIFGPNTDPHGEPAGPSSLSSLTDGIGVAALGEPGSGGRPGSGGTPSIDPAVRAAFADEELVPVIVRLRDQVDVSSVAAEARAAERAAGRVPDKQARGRAVVAALQDKASATQGPVRGLLQAEQSANRTRNVRSYWIFNGFAAEVSGKALERLERHPDVASVTLDAELSLPEPASSNPPRLPTWGLEHVNAPTVWGDYGFTGEGVVVGIMDSGVDGGHPALSGQYRGRDGDHSDAWYAATGENYATPGDGFGHGTHVMGSILGGPPGEVIGVAPDAEWIAAKIFRDSGSTTTSIIHDGFQWMLAPGGDPSKAPDVVNNSWGSTATNSIEFWDDVNAWVAAGIFPAFANGNAGPGPGTVGSPGSFPQSFGVGATDINDFIAAFSSRGPAVWEGVEHIKPQVSAPGHQIFSAWPLDLDPDGYNTISGTSMATPHLSGVVALLLSAQPDLSVDALRDLLISTARAEPHMGNVPNNEYGAGIVDAEAALIAARFSGTLTGTVTGPDGPIAATVAIPDLGVSTISDGTTGVYELVVRAGSWEVTASAYGYLPDAADVTIAAGEELMLDFALGAAPVHTVSGTVTSGGSAVAGAVVRALNTPTAAAYTDAAGAYSMQLAQGTHTLAADATGYRRATAQIELTGDVSIDFSLAPLAGNVDAGWDEYQNNPARTGRAVDQLAAPALTQTWTTDLSGQIMFASPVIAGERVYVAFDSGRLVAFDITDGSQLWAFTTGTALRTTPAVADGIVYLGGGDSGIFHAIDAGTGQPHWSFATGDRLTYATPTVVDGTVYFGTGWGPGNGGWVYALDAATGAQRWRSFIGPEIYFAPAVSGGLVYAASYDAQRLVALDAATGAEVWQLTRSDDSFAAMPSVADGVLYSATNNFDTGVGSVLAVDAANGALLWEATGHGDAAGNTPVVYADLVIVGSSQNNWVVGYDRASGERRWVAPIGSAVSNSQLAADGVIVGGSQQDHRAWALDAYTGDLLWEQTLADNVLSAPALADGRLVIADRSGGLYAYEAPGTVMGTVTGPTGPLAAVVRVAGTDDSTETDPVTGAYELAVRPGEVTVEALAYGYVATVAEVTIRSGQITSVDFTLAAAGDGSLGGVVRDEAGGPLAGVTVSLEEGPLEPQTTGPDGSFAFPAVAEGSYGLNATLPGYAPLDTDVAIVAGAATSVELTLLKYEIAVTGDHGGAITRLLTAEGYRVESTTAAAIASRPTDYELIVANGVQDDPGAAAFNALLANADAAGTSIVFLDTWGISYGAIRHLVAYTGDPQREGSGYNDGSVSLVATADHPLTVGLAPGELIPVLSADKEYAWFADYSGGRSVADVHLGELGTVGAGIGYAARGYGNAHVLLSLHAASPWVGPTDGWTPAAHQVFRNAIGWALDASFGAAAGSVTDAGTGGGLPATVTALETGDSTTAGADGTYLLLLPAGEHTLRFERVGYVAVEESVTITAGAEASVDVQLASSGLGGLTGVVTDANDGAAIDGAAVTVVGSGADPGISDASGAYAVDDVPGGTYAVEVAAAGYTTRTIPDVEIVNGAVTELDVELDAAPRVAVLGDYAPDPLVTVLNDAGMVASGAGWEVVGNLDQYDVIVVNSPTDPGKAAFLAALAAFDEAGVSTIFIESATSTGNGIRLLRVHLGQPTGRDFVSSDGNPLFHVVDPGHPLFAGLASPVQVLVEDEWGAYFTGYDGITLADFGTDELGVLGLGAAYEPRTPSSVRLLLAALASSVLARPNAGWTPEGEQLFLNAVRWAAAPGLGSVTGRITDAADEPVAADLRIWETGVSAQTAADGSYTIPHAAGELTVEITAFGYVTQQHTVNVAPNQATELSVNLQLAAVGAISGVVTSRPDLSPDAEPGQPLAGVTVRLVGQPRSAITDEDGAYLLPNVESGTYEVEFDVDGHVRQVEPEVEVAAGATTPLDVAMRPSPRVGVIDDCQQNTGCTNKMQGYLAEWGYLPQEIAWTDTGLLAELDLVVANLGDFPRLDPGAEGMAAFQDAANRAHVPVIWLEQFQRGSIRWLSEYEGDPASVGEGRVLGPVSARIVADHPLTAGFAVGQDVPIIVDANPASTVEHTWFNGYSGTTVANLAAPSTGVRGSSIAYRGRTASSVDVLFSSFAASFYTWPPVGGAPAELITPQAERLFHNALNWALDAPPLAAEARGVLTSSAGGTLAGTVTVQETGESYPARPGDGSFVVPLQPGDWTLAFEAFGHDPETRSVSVAAGDAVTVNLTLNRQASGSLGGTVRAEGGAPIGGASVAILGTPLSAVTAADGSYAIGGVPVGEHDVRVQADGFAVVQQSLSVVEGQNTLDVTLPVSAVVAVAGDYLGRIGAFLTANGYEVRAWSWADPQNHIPELGEVGLVILNGNGTAPTAAEFATFIDAADAAQVSVILAGIFGGGAIRRASDYLGDPDGYAQAFTAGGVYYRPAVSHPIFAGFPVGQTIEMLRDPAGGNQQYEFFTGYSGTTLAALGTDLAGDLGGGVGVTFSSPASVHVLLDSLAAATYASPPDGWSAAAAQIYLNAVEFALDAAQGQITGTVTDGASGAPLPDVLVTALEAGVSAFTAPDGTYRLGVPDGTHTVRFELLGYETSEQAVTVAQEETVTLDVALTAVPRGAIAGSVVAPDGAAVAGAVVSLSGPADAQARTDATGAFAFADLLPGEYSLDITAEGFQPAAASTTVVAGQTASVSVTLTPNDTAVLGDVDGVMLDFLRANEVAAEEIEWATAADAADRFEVIIINGGDPTEAEFDALLAAADEAATSVIFTGTWGVANGGVRLLEAFEPEMVTVGQQGYGDGAVSIAGLDLDHPIFADLTDPSQLLAEDGYWAAIDEYVGPYHAQLDVANVGDALPLGVAVASDWRTAESLHVVLGVSAVTGLIGPGYGWTDDGERLLLNAVAWAADATQPLPAAPTLSTGQPLLGADPTLAVTGTAEFRSSVSILRAGEVIGTAEPARDGSFGVEVTLLEGANQLTAVATNFAGDSAPSASLDVVLDTTGPSLDWTPADGDGVFGSVATVAGTVTDTHAGVAELLVNGDAVAFGPGGAFTTGVPVVTGENTITVLVRDALGNETLDSRTVASFPYESSWQVVGENGKGALTAFLQITDGQGEPTEVDSARAELRLPDGTLVADDAMTWDEDEERYRANLGRPPRGTYRLWGVLVVDGWNVTLEGPALRRR